MQDLFFGQGAAWFTIPALVGSVFFLIRIVLLLVGAGAHDLGMDFHDGGGAGAIHAGGLGDAHTGGLTGDAAHHDSGHDFQVLSTQSIAAFLMGFGWAALAAYKGSHWHWPAVTVAGGLGGVAMVWLLALLLKGMADLQSSGNIPLAAALGAEGDVYVNVPETGQGQVRLTVSGRQRFYNAVTGSAGGGEPLPTGTRIRVIKVNTDNTLTVTRA